MNLLKTSSDILTRIGEPFAAKTDAQGHRRAMASAIILLVTIILYWWLYL